MSSSTPSTSDAIDLNAEAAAVETRDSSCAAAAGEGRSDVELGMGGVGDGVSGIAGVASSGGVEAVKSGDGGGDPVAGVAEADKGGGRSGVMEAEVAKGGVFTTELAASEVVCLDSGISVQVGHNSTEEEPSLEVGSKVVDVGATVVVGGSPTEDPSGVGSHQAEDAASRPSETVGMDTSPGGGENAGLKTVGFEVEALQGDEPRSRELEEGQNSGLDDDFSASEDSAESSDWEDGAGRDTKAEVKVQQLSHRVERPNVKHAIVRLETSHAEIDKHVSYCFPREENDEFSVSDLVWGKVKSHPWWPGQIFDPSYASEMALKHQRKDNFLVAYFGDKTFAWCDESQLKPFSSFFSQMEKQSTAESFLNAVDSALAEMSRCVELGVVCSCVPEESYSTLKFQTIENAGIQEGVSVSAVDKSLGPSSFQPDKFVDYIRELARFPTRSADRLELTIAHAQLVAYDRSRGYTRPPPFFSGQFESTSPSRNCVEHPTPVSTDEERANSALSSGKVKRKRGRPPLNKQKSISEDGRKQKSLSELMEDKEGNHLANGSGRVSDKKHQITDSVPIDLGKSKKKRLDSLGDLETKTPTPTPYKSFKVGECIRRVASKLTSSPLIHKGNGETVQKSSVKLDSGNDSPFSLDSAPDFPEENQRIETVILKDFSSMDEMLSQLCLAAREPMKGFVFLSKIISFFSEIRKVYISSSIEYVTSYEEIGHKRSRKKLLLSSDFVEDFDSSERIVRKRGRKKLVSDSYSAEDIKLSEEVPRKRGRKKKVPPSSSCAEDIKPSDEFAYTNLQKISDLEIDAAELSMPDYMKDSYWTDVVIHSGPEKKRRGRPRKSESQLQSPPCTAKKPNVEASETKPTNMRIDTPDHLRVSSASPSKNYGLASERRTQYFGNKCMESSPTALILGFADVNSVPSQTELVRTFSCYGPLKEAETEVLKKEKSAKVVFRRRADAEVAFSYAGKNRFFGAALISYRIKYLPSASEISPLGASSGKKESTPVESCNVEVSGNIKNEVSGFSLAAAGAKLDEVPLDNSNTEVLRKEDPKPMDICNLEVAGTEKDQMPLDDDNLRVPVVERYEAPTNDGTFEVSDGKPDLISADVCHLDVQAQDRGDAPADSCDMNIQDIQRDQIPMDVGYSESLVDGTSLDTPGGRRDATPGNSREVLTGSTENPAQPDAGNLMVQDSGRDRSVDDGNAEIPAIEKDESPADHCDLEVQGTERDEMTMEVGHSESPPDGVNLGVPDAKRDAMPVDSEDVLIGSSGNPTPSDVGDLDCRKDGPPVDGNVEVPAIDKDESPADSCSLEVQGVSMDIGHLESPADSTNLHLPDPRRDATPMVSGEVHTGSTDTVAQLVVENIIVQDSRRSPIVDGNVEIPGNEKDELNIDSGSFDVSDKSPASIDIRHEEVEGKKGGETLADNRHLENTGIKINETPIGCCNLEVLNNAKEPGPIDVCDVDVQGQKSYESHADGANMEVAGGRGDETPTDTGKLAATDITANPATVDVCDVMVKGNERDESLISSGRMEVLDITKDETHIGGDNLDTIDSRSDPATLVACILDAPGRKTEETPTEGSDLEIPATGNNETLPCDEDVDVSDSKTDERPSYGGNAGAPVGKTDETTSSGNSEVQDSKRIATESNGAQMETKEQCKDGLLEEVPLESLI